MPTSKRLAEADLISFSRAILSAAGAREADAEAVAHHLVTADLAGHESHGTALLPTYARHAREGLVALDSENETLQETAALLQVDARGGWGVSAANCLIDAAATKAKTNGLVAATLAKAHHLGRIGAYGERVAALGLVGIFFVNVTDHDPLVAPYRGTDARFGTNPICIAFPPQGQHPAFVLDIATSRIALGKVRLAAARGNQLPADCLLDNRGMPTTDPAGMAGFELRGALTPFGYHKGYGLAFAAEFLAGVLSRSGTIQPENQRRGGIQNGLFSVLMDPAAFGDPTWIEDEISAMADYALSSPPMEWDTPVLYPGAPERAFTGKRRREGIPMEDVVLEQLNALADELGIQARL
ncbi:Ldh family oxidoreductase [Maricaulis sp. CAU 1757]